MTMGSFTSSLRQRKQPFGVKIALKFMQNLWEKGIQMNHETCFTNNCGRQITGICAVI